MLRIAIDTCFKGDQDVDEKRRIVLLYLTGEESARKRYRGVVRKTIIDDWLKYHKDDATGEWLIDAVAVKEMRIDHLPRKGNQ